MLNVKHAHHFHLPRISLPSKRILALSPIRAEKDELIQAIDDARNNRDDNWTLTSTPDTDQLAQFWQGVERDIQNDPEWIRFSDD